MSSPTNTNNFLSLIPTAHRVAVITQSDSTLAGEESIIPTTQKTRRSSSTATSDSNTDVEEASAPVNPPSSVVESPTKVISIHTFLSN
ncbi:hypothetical protein A1O3_04128 [Capronia epimyces CBS 606.96]|uniref:Uncharacterized protein n=1 Tax=Capronia epimyces CBS 606.96 TaxID=1182542 RepID=W9YXY8_9EURO|nr:uncharacterized protein A1O3_04128 [Capronia epimyces CBS 606.96]EXJ87169.1 hypothetical protein A1O3_04128 [Capronia epimyces CBS 606.96]